MLFVQGISGNYLQVHLMKLIKTNVCKVNSHNVFQENTNEDDCTINFVIEDNEIEKFNHKDILKIHEINSCVFNQKLIHGNILQSVSNTNLLLST